MDHYKEKPLDYYSNIRYDLIEMIDFEAKSILDIGCGDGSTANVIKDKTNAEFAAGIELFEDAAEEAQKRLDSVIVGNIENNEIQLESEKYDLVVCADVLEHLVDPWKVLFKLRKSLKNNGRILASLPNLAYFPVVLQILRDKFEYEDAGVLDKTHLRFFTLHTIIKMFEHCGFEIIKIESNKGRGIKSKLLSIFSFGLLSKSRIYQYKILARKKN